MVMHRNFAQFEYVVLGALMTIVFHMQEPQPLKVGSGLQRWFVCPREEERVEPDLDKLSHFAIKRRRRRTKYFTVKLGKVDSLLALFNGRMM